MNTWSRTVIFCACLVTSLRALPLTASDLDYVAKAASCIITESEVVDLASSTEGRLAKVLSKVGDRVVKGQLVAALENDLEKLTRDIAQARADRDIETRIKKRELAAAQADLSTQKKLLKRKVASMKVVNEAQTAMDLANLELERAEHDRVIAAIDLKQAEAVLRRRSIFSPLDGVVTEIHRQTGEHINAANPVITIAAVDTLLVETYLPIEAYPMIQKGLPATIFPQEPIGGRYETVVETRAPVIDAASGLFRVDLNLDNNLGQIPAGIRCSVQFFNHDP